MKTYRLNYNKEKISLIEETNRLKNEIRLNRFKLKEIKEKLRKLNNDNRTDSQNNGIRTIHRNKKTE